MKNYTQCLGFDDRLLRLTGIPLAALIIPPVFFSGVSNEWQVYVFSLVYTLAVWEGNRGIFIGLNLRFPDMKSWRRRLFWLLVLCTGFTALACPIIGITTGLLGRYMNFREIPISVGNAYGASYVMLLAIGAIYESIRLFGLWAQTVKEKEQLERAHLASQLEGLRNQVNPHFLFNSLNTLIYLIPEDSDKAVRFVQQLSKVYRYVLESRDEKVIPLRDELTFLESYIFLLKERFGNNLRVDLDHLESMRDILIVPLTLQILFENAIKHNVISAQYPLEIQLGMENGRLFVRNALKRKNQVMDSTGVGLENIRMRYQILTAQPIEIRETEDSFTVLLPVIKLERQRPETLQQGTSAL